MPEEMREKLKRAAAFNEGYRKDGGARAAAQLDMQWHTLAVGAVAADMDAFEAAALDPGGNGDAGDSAAVIGQATLHISGAGGMRRDTMRISGARRWMRRAGGGLRSMAG